MSKYIKEFNKVGESIVNVPLICKDWNSRFSMSTWDTEKGREYTFYVNGKDNNMKFFKTRISEEQALEIVSKLSLLYVGDSFFKSGGGYYSKETLSESINSLNDTIKEKEMELGILENKLYSFTKALNSK